MQIQLMIAYAAGLDAAEQGKGRAPCQSAVIMSLVADLSGPIGGHSGTLDIFDAYARGYQAHCDKVARAVLA